MKKSFAFGAAALLFTSGALGASAFTAHAQTRPAHSVITAGSNQPVSPRADRHSRHHQGWPTRMMSQVVVDTAHSLHMPIATVRHDLRAGQSLAAIAQAHGSSAAALETALEHDLSANIQRAQAQGQLTAAQAAHWNAHLSHWLDRWVTHTPGQMKRHPWNASLRWHRLVADAAQTLHLPVASVRHDLRAGQSLAAIAQAHGSSAAHLESSLLERLQAPLTRAVQKGKLSTQAANALKGHLSTLIDRLVTETPHQAHRASP